MRINTKNQADLGEKMHNVTQYPRYCRRIEIVGVIGSFVLGIPVLSFSPFFTLIGFSLFIRALWQVGRLPKQPLDTSTTRVGGAALVHRALIQARSV